MALEKARDTEQPAATATEETNPEKQSEPEILVFQPVYRPGQPPTSIPQRHAGLLGFAVETLHLSHLIRTSLPEAEGQGVEYRLFDADSDTPGRTGLSQCERGGGGSDRD